MRTATAPPARTVAALEAARRRLALRRSIDLVASPLCEAPAVIRVLRPLIILPIHGCDALDDDELQSLLCHECAHVARHDNLAGVLEAIVYSLFWFNPVVWLARRRLALAREAACDELVADTASRAETYVGALAKFCGSLIAPPLPSVSCMASAHLKERMQHIMRYESLKSRALSHRAVAVTSIVAAALFIIGAGAATALPDKPPSTSARYLLGHSISHDKRGDVVIYTKVIDTNDSTLLGEATMTTKPDVPVTAQLERGNVRVRLEVDPHRGKSGQIALFAYEDGKLTQTTVFDLQAATTTAPARTYQGEPISMNLKDADLREVLQKFADMTGLKMTIDDNVHGTVTANFTQVPWDEVLDRVLKDHGLAYELHGNQMHIFVK